MSAYKIFSHIWSSITKFIPSEAEPTYYSSLVLYSEHIVLRMCKMIQYSTHTEKYCHPAEMLNSNGSHSAHTALSHSYCSLLLPPPSYHLHHCRYNCGPCHPLFFQSASLFSLPSFSSSVRVRWCVMPATLLCPLTTSLLLLHSFLLVLIFSLSFQSHFFFSLCCPQDSNLLCFSLCGLLVSLHVASTTAQIRMDLSCVSSAQKVPTSNFRFASCCLFDIYL